MPELMSAASPVEIEAKADEADLPHNAREAALRLFHDLTSRLELAAIDQDQAGGEEWPRHRFYFGPKGGEMRRLVDRLRAQPNTAEATAVPSRDEARRTLFITSSDGGFEAVLIACADASLLRSLTQQVEARPGGTE